MVKKKEKKKEKKMSPWPYPGIKTKREMKAREESHATENQVRVLEPPTDRIVPLEAPLEDSTRTAKHY